MTRREGELPQSVPVAFARELERQECRAERLREYRATGRVTLVVKPQHQAGRTFPTLAELSGESPLVEFEPARLRVIALRERRRHIAGLD